MAVLNFPDPAGQSPANTFGPASTPHATSNGVTYVWTDGSWSIASGSSSGQLLDKDTADSYYVEQAGDNMTGNLTLGTDKITLDATDGKAEFADEVTVSNGSYGLTDPDGRGARITPFGSIDLQRQNGSSSAFRVYTKDEETVKILAEGSATFADAVTASRLVCDLNKNRNDTTRLSRWMAQSIDSVVFYTNGSATFASDITAGNVTFNLEPDNDANYVTTTDVDEEGNTVETRVYNGPTLDVKAVIQELQQRVADRDAVIADFTARLAALEADHATLMSNNGGSY